MDHTMPSRRAIHGPKAKTGPARKFPASKNEAELRDELSRQRAELLNGADMSLAMSGAPETSADIADQSSADHDQDVAIEVKSRTFDRLRRIERALHLIRTKDYGRCCRCRGEIPAKRLEVQPDALYCVPCQTLLERRTLT
jgi:DnaK suppressor protein